MFNLSIKTIPHEQQRYPTVGDWQWDPSTETLTIQVSDLGNWKKEALIGIHEAIEAVILAHRGVSTLDVDQFDMAYEARRQSGDVSEPGNHPLAPYRKEHFFATNVERLLSAQLEIDWEEYNRQVEEL